MTLKRKSQPAKAKQKGKRSIKKKDRSAQFFMLWGMIILYIVVFSYLSIIRYESYQSSAYDMGIMIQVIWNTSQGWFLQDSINMGYPVSRFWVAHWEFIFILIALIYKVFSHPYTILILQSVIISLGALPLYWLGKQIIHDKATALTFAFAYLMYPAIQNANLIDIHGLTFAASLLIFTFYFLIKKNFKLFYLFGFLSLLCREDMALILIMLGIYSFIVQKEKKHGAIIAVISLLWFSTWLFRMKIRTTLGLPEFQIMAGADTHWSHLGQLSQDPLYLFKFLAKKYNIRYFIYLFVPLLLLSFIEWKVLLISAPIFAINLLSSYYYTHDVEHYYSATVAPFVFISAIYGLNKVNGFFREKLNHRFKERTIRENVLSISSTLILILSIVFFFIKSNSLDFRHWKITDHHRVIDQVTKMISAKKSVTAEAGLVPKVAERNQVYVFSDNIGKVDYILWDFYAPAARLEIRSSYHLPFIWPDDSSIIQVLKDTTYGIIHYEDGVCLLEKGADYTKGIRDLAIDVGTAIERFNKQEINTVINFLGHNEYQLLKAYFPIENSEEINWKYAIHFTCFWSLREKLDQDRLVVVKYETKDQIYYQSHTPVWGLYPTSQWQPDEIVKDEIFWELPDSAAAGQYQISVAFVDPGATDYQQENFIKLFDLNIEIPKEK